MPKHEPFFGATRAQILGLLKGNSLTVDEIARETDLTRGAIRVQLATMERDGLVMRVGTKRGFRKPHIVYELSDRANALNAAPYASVLATVLQALEESVPVEARMAILREAGRRLALPHKGSDDEEWQARVERAVTVLRALGGEVAVAGDTIKGRGCPLSSVTANFPVACQVVASMLSTLLGVPVVEDCSRGSRPSCRFILTMAKQ